LGEQEIEELRRQFVNKNKIKVGRKEGYRKPKEILVVNHQDIIDLLNKGTSIRNIGKITGKSTTTIQKVKKNI
jgi:transposase-like protein